MESCFDLSSKRLQYWLKQELLKYLCFQVRKNELMEDGSGERRENSLDQNLSEILVHYDSFKAFLLIVNPFAPS